VLIDNYDSFTHNLAQYIREQRDTTLAIIKNDAFDIEDLETFDKIMISPGPGLPATNGRITELVLHYSGIKPILGICLGLQAIYEAFGGQLHQLQSVHHGVSSSVKIADPDDPLFKHIKNPFQAGRYHSWVCDRTTCPDALIITATDQQGTIMACRHQSHATHGVQFHPESILTPQGKNIIRNFVELIH
jgi:anthranilate synthase component 2